MGRNTHRQNQNVQNVGRFGFTGAIWRSSCRRVADVTARRSVIHLTFANTFSDPVVGLRRRNRPAVGYPPYVAKIF
ncbi:MAG: hypothetical protein LBQ66_14675 [Planctomycetaceae bacterium]|nr:hypothetical protein [Planctomycetaceae bacterium]